MGTIGHTLCVLVCLGLLSGCQPQPSHRNAIPFEEGQSYAVAYLGYQQTTELDYYAARYLDGEPLPIHYLSDGDYYLVIPRYDGMEVALYRNDIEGGPPVLLYEAPDCQPFVLQCNASDIFPDATIRLGGLRAKSGAVEADDTLDMKLEAQKDWFLQNSGMSIAL